MNVRYYIGRKYRQIKTLIEWVPIIWNTFDFDYNYSINVFKFQLERQAKYLESGNANTMSAKDKASEIRTALALMNKVYDEDYALEYQQILAKEYGDNVLDLNFGDENDEDETKRYLITYEYKKWGNSKDIDRVHSRLFKKSQLKQKRAHKLLWDFIEHNIQSWWD